MDSSNLQKQLNGKRMDNGDNASTDERPPMNAPPMVRTSSSSTTQFRNNYDSLLREVLEDNVEDDDDLLSNIDIDVNAATAELPEELRAALEDRSLANKYLANLRTFMSHRRTRSLSSTANSKGEYTSPTLPLQQPFSQSLSPRLPNREKLNPLSKVLDSVQYQNRLVNGVQPLTVLEQRFHALRIPELDLPSVLDTIIQARLIDMYKIQDDLYIHLCGGPLVAGVIAQNINAKKKEKVMLLLDDVAKEIGVYEEFIKREHYLSLESILNESDTSDVDDYQDSEIMETESSLAHFDSVSEISRATTGTPMSTMAQSTSPISQPDATPHTSPHLHRVRSHPSLVSAANSIVPKPSTSSTIFSSPSRASSDIGRLSDRSPSISQLLDDGGLGDGREHLEPWEAFKWTPLIKISEQLYKDAAQNGSGLVTVIAVSGVIAIGTTRCLVFVYDYFQQLKCILGGDLTHVDWGWVTAIAISADHTTIVCGHSQGYVVVWDINKPSQPVRIIEPIPEDQVPSLLSPAGLTQRHTARKEGHIKGSAILHVGFVGVKKSEIVSGDDCGMAFYHVLYKVVMVNAVDTTRILGRYQSISSIPSTIPHPTGQNGLGVHPLQSKPRRPSTVFAMQPLPLGQAPHPAEQFGLVALLTPYKMIIVGLKPSPQTQYKFLKPKKTTLVTGGHVDVSGQSQSDENLDHKSNLAGVSGCLAWLPATKSGAGSMNMEKEKLTRSSKNNIQSANDPMLAFAWGNHLVILQACVVVAEARHEPGHNRTSFLGKSKRSTRLEFTKLGEYQCRDTIVALQWVNRQILVLFTPNEEMILFDPKNMVETATASIRSKQLVYHDHFTLPLKEIMDSEARMNGPESRSKQPLMEMAYYHSIKSYKGRLFLLGLEQVFVGTLLSWADRILALVQAGDFLEGIQLATQFYNGQCIQTVVGLPDDEEARKDVVGKLLLELLEASLNYAFSSKRTYDGMVDDLAGGAVVMFQDLAAGCIEACLSMGNLEFLFETAYERFVEVGVSSVFLEVLEPYIVQHHLSDVPPSVMKNLVDHYSKKKLLSQLEQVIWHVNPRSLDIDQIVGMCHREGLYEAMIYVWTRNMDDYVSPMVEILKVIRKVLKDESIARLEGDQGMSSEMQVTGHLRHNAEKIFDYLKHVLTGRTYPDKQIIPVSKATEARSAVYSFIFSGRCIIWPRVGGRLVLTADEEEEMSEPTYPYLRLLLRFNTRQFLEALEVAFEDPWLNGGEDILTSTFEDEMPGKAISRQIIVNTLLDVMGGTVSSVGLAPPTLGLPPPPSNSGSGPSSDALSSTYDSTSASDNLAQFYMFIASNLHKYTTFILLPPKTLYKILVWLAEYHCPNTREERQQAVQSLLTVYRQTHEEEERMLPLYEEAGFWKVLETAYRRDKKYGKLVETYLKDDERHEHVFQCLCELLDERSPLSEKLRAEVKRAFMIRISQCVDINGQKTATIVARFCGGDHMDTLRRLQEDGDQEFDDDEEHRILVDQRIFSYLHGLLEPMMEDVMLMPESTDAVQSQVDPVLIERYIDLMCRFDPSGVYHYLQTFSTDRVNMDMVLASCEKFGVLDAAVCIMEQQGKAEKALDMTLNVAKDKINTILTQIREHTQNERRPWTIEERSTISSCLIGLGGVLRVGTRLCETSGHTPKANETEPLDSSQEPETVETLWLRLLDAYVEASIDVHVALGQSKNSGQAFGVQEHVVSSFKSFVQSILTSLLLSTSPQVSLPRLLSRLIESQTCGDTTFADFRDIFLSMLDTYKYEGKLLEMTNRLFDRDLYGSLKDMVHKRSRGRRPLRGLCELCRLAVLDPSLVQPQLAWDDDDDVDNDNDNDDDDDDDGNKSTEQEVGPEEKSITLFYCGHIYHRKCLETQTKIKRYCPSCHPSVPSDSHPSSSSLSWASSSTTQPDTKA